MGQKLCSDFHCHHYKCDAKPNDACPDIEERMVGCPFKLNWRCKLSEILTSCEKIDSEIVRRMIQPWLYYEIYSASIPLWHHYSLHYSFISLEEMNGVIGFADQQGVGLGTVQVNLRIYKSPTSSLRNYFSGSL